MSAKRASGQARTSVWKQSRTGAKTAGKRASFAMMMSTKQSRPADVRQHGEI
jgi:hypothetical protein